MHYVRRGFAVAGRVTLKPFKKGPFYLAMDTGAPVVPVSIWGTDANACEGQSEACLSGDGACTFP